MVTDGQDSTEPSRVGLSRAVIVDAALRVVSEEGLHALSLRRLAADLGVTAPALYAHVRDKSDLLRAVAETGFRHLLDRYAQITVEDPIDRVHQMCSMYVELAVETPGLFEAMFAFRPESLSDPDVETALPAAAEAIERPMRAVSDAIAEGSIDPGHDAFVAGLTMWTVAHGLASVFNLGLFDAGTRHALETSVFEATLRGLALPPTR